MLPTSGRRSLGRLSLSRLFRCAVALGSAAAALAVVVLPTSTASADVPEVVFTVDVFVHDPGAGSTYSACAGGQRTWTAHPRVVITNDRDQTLTVTHVSFAGRWTMDGDTQRSTSAHVVDDGGLAPGATIDLTAQYQTTATVDLPCSPDPIDGQVRVTVDAENGLGGTGSDTGGDSIISTVMLFHAADSGSTYSSSPCQQGERTWDLMPAIVVDNRSEGATPTTLTDAGFLVRFSDGIIKHDVTNVDVIDAGGWGPGLTLTDGDTTTYTPHLRVTLPCDPDPVYAAVGLTAMVGTWYFGQSPTNVFTGSVPTPVGTIGLLGLAALLALGFGLLQRRSRRAAAR